ncbi:unnamed protein product [Allacma fusca]|uniref:Rab11 family-interacting protein 1 n=1 Tax=Allacma fusca TaxID=39272 RepID=A0A8J2PKS5_9HEXA|nr:unnamed protein product [Allacma fusca]
MWTPTHVQVTVQRAKGLLFKGKNGTNDVFVTIALGKEKYQTSVKERATDPVDWHEECELPIPKQGNKAEVILTALHRNFIGDEFLGQTTIPLSDFDVYEKPKNKWYTLRSKPGQEKKTKERGELEVRIGFTVRSAAAGSLSDLSKKDGLRSSFGQLSSMASSVGGSLLSLRGKEKKGGLKNLAKAVGSKVSTTLPRRDKKKHSEDQFGTIPEQQVYSSKKQSHADADPGVISDDEDEFHFDELSHKSSHSSLSVSQVALSSPKDGSLENLGGGEFLRRNYNTPPPGKPPRTPTAPAPEPHRWSAGPIDEWDAKLFGKQHNLVNNNKAQSQDALNVTPVVDTKINEEPETKGEDPPPKPEVPTEGVKALLFATSTIFKNNQDKEPVPKPRQVQEVKEEIKTSSPIATVEPHEKEVQDESKKHKEKDKGKDKDKNKNGHKDTFASIFASPKSKAEEVSNSKGTPVGITNPIRVKDQQEIRIPREAIRRFDGKSREDLIEMVLSLQSTVDYQKQKMNDMEDYIDNLIVRVMENKPTLLQSPFVGVRPMKTNGTKWSF